MKRILFSSIILGLLTLGLVSCEPSSIDTKKSATEPYFPEPCLAWGSNMEMVKSQMLSLGYILYDVDDDERMVFVYNDFGCECYFENGLYVLAEFEGLNAEVGQNIDNNYKKSCTSLFVIDKDDDYWEFFETKDGKTYISIEYDPSGYHTSSLAYVSKYSPLGKEFYEGVKDYFEEVNDKNNPDSDPDAE